MSTDNGFNYRFPACEFVQGGKVQYMASVPYKVLKSLFPPETEKNALKRAQRVLNKKHASDIGNYIYNATFRNKPYILPTIIASVEGECSFEPSLELNSLGMLNIPMDMVISAFDGQHRIAGIIEAIGRINVQDSISVLFVPNTNIALRQQFFSDINDNAVKPSKSLCLAYAKKSRRDQVIYSLYEALGRPEFIDLDHNTVPVNSNKTLSYKQFYDATRLMFDGKPEKVDIKEFLANGSGYWEHWFTAMNYLHNWNCNVTVEYRQEYIGYHGVFLTAWALTVARFRQQKIYEQYQVISVMNHFWLDFAAKDYLKEKWIGICIVEQTGRVDLSTASKQAIADQYYSAIMKRLKDKGV
ncbi:DNA sulfur modification protein DndB [Pectobacterium versatile]|uniref:DNA sulfur modification protein DndB n=1 Tax=Pectobacterium versatile TaxID=2488639 RepID=UPI001F3304CF|nr:DNA sulfur modification protein DndB [Pectobacterium versatile]